MNRKIMTVIFVIELVLLVIGLVFLVVVSNHRESFCLERGFDGHKAIMCFEIVDDRNIEFVPIQALKLIERYEE